MHAMGQNVQVRYSRRNYVQATVVESLGQLVAVQLPDGRRTWFSRADLRQPLFNRLLSLVF